VAIAGNYRTVTIARWLIAQVTIAQWLYRAGDFIAQVTIAPGSGFIAQVTSAGNYRAGNYRAEWLIARVTHYRRRWLSALSGFIAQRRLYRAGNLSARVLSRR
jgi:hypothetical protein